VVGQAWSHRDRSGSATPQAKLVVIAALLPRGNLIMGAASQVGGDMAAGDEGGGPSLVAGSRSPPRRVRVPSCEDHRHERTRCAGVTGPSCGQSAGLGGDCGVVTLGVVGGSSSAGGRRPAACSTRAGR